MTTTIQKAKTGSRTNTTSRQNNTNGLAIQAKLTIGQPNDKYEQEADRIADRVMRMPDRNTVLRKCADCEKEEKIRKKPLAASITPYIQRQAEGVPQVSSALESRLNSSKSGGRSLPSKTRTFMENRIGADFSKIKIHTDSSAVQMSRELGAQAFTHGNHIYFNSGKYNPESASGKHLLAHEMVHTLHQNKNTMLLKPIQTEGKSDLRKEPKIIYFESLKINFKPEKEQARLKYIFLLQAHENGKISIIQATGGQSGRKIIKDFKHIPNDFRHLLKCALYRFFQSSLKDAGIKKRKRQWKAAYYSNFQKLKEQIHAGKCPIPSGKK